MKLTQFNGGLNIRSAPNFVSPNQGVIYENIDNSKGHFVSILDKVDVTDTLGLEDVGDYGFYFEQADEIYFTDDQHDWVVFQERLYTCDRVGVPQKRVAPNTFRNLGIVGPTVPPTVTPSGTPSSDTVQYIITYYNSADGAESIGVVSAEVIRGDAATNLSAIPVSTDPQVTHKGIYRVGGDLTQFTLVTRITNATTTYADTIADNAVEGSLLQSQTWGQAPAGLKYLVEAYAMLFGALGDHLYFTPVGQPNAWPPLYYLDMPNDITGIAVTPVGLLVFTTVETVLVTGSGPLVLSQQSLTKGFGCVSHDSIVNVQGAAIWLSRDGICSSNGGEVVLISKDKLGKLYLVAGDITNATVYDECYLLQLHTGKTFIWDFGYGSIPKYWDHNLVSLATANNELYGFAGGRAYRLSNGAGHISAHYKSGWISFNDLVKEKVQDSFKIAYRGQITFNLYVDGVLARTFELSSDSYAVLEQKVPTEFTRYSFVEVEFIGTGEVFEFDLEGFDANA